MIDETQSRIRYIGASDNRMVNSSFGNKTFIDWWAYKTGIIDKTRFDNIYTKLGNIAEPMILSHIGIDKKFWNIKKIIPGTYIGCNYDALLPDMIIEIKTMKASEASHILFGSTIPIGYRRQMDHEMYVANIPKARIYILPVYEKDYINPFGIDMEGLFFKEHELPDISKYVSRLNYLDFCLKINKTPSDNDFELWKG